MCCVNCGHESSPILRYGIDYIDDVITRVLYTTYNYPSNISIIGKKKRMCDNLSSSHKTCGR